MTQIKKFIILSHGRTGSTALCRALSMHPNVIAHEEVFHGEPRRRAVVNGRVFDTGGNAGTFCREHVFATTGPMGKRTVGFKIFFFHSRGNEQEYSLWPYLTGSRDISVILLLRKNIFDVYVSEMRSRRHATI